MIEIWKDVKGYDNMYQVSNLGRVKSVPRTGVQHHNATQVFKGRILKPYKKPKRGYMSVVFSKGNTLKTYSVHRLVAKAFIPNPENKYSVNHINGNPSDNIITNLEWATASEQMQHAVKIGLQPIGSKHPHSKLTENYVREIRDYVKNNARYYSNGKPWGYGRKALAEKYGVTESTIKEVVNGHKNRAVWEHVK